MFQILFFFFQAEDGIRDRTVTGVQTCALPILLQSDESAYAREKNEGRIEIPSQFRLAARPFFSFRNSKYEFFDAVRPEQRSEERRVGKECRSQWARYHLTKNKRKELKHRIRQK